MKKIEMKRKKIWVLAFWALLLISLLVIWTVYSIFVVRKVAVISVTDELNDLEILNNKNLLLLDENYIAKLLLSKNKIFSRIIIRKKYPNSLEIETINRVPVAYLTINNRKIFVDQNGIFIPNINYDSEKYTAIEVPNLLILNLDKIDWRIVKAIKLIVAASKNTLNINKISLNESSGIYHIFLVEGEEAEFSQEQDPYLIAASLQIIISRFRIEGEIISQIKFQFDKPVVVLKSGEKISSI